MDIPHEICHAGLLAHRPALVWPQRSTPMGVSDVYALAAAAPLGQRQLSGKHPTRRVNPGLSPLRAV